MKPENIKATIEEQVAIANEATEPMERLRLTLEAVETALKELRQTPIEGEITFFKVIKPTIYAYKIEALMRYSIDSNKPIGTNDMLLEYYREELRYLQRFFSQNAFAWHYYKYKATELDHLWFTRSARPEVPLVDIPESDPEFSTPMDYLFAKFIAYERLQYYVLEQITQLQFPGFLHKEEPGAPELKWTGDSINLVELIYGIWLTGQLNNGNASLASIVIFFEKHFHVSIGRPHRRFIEIERRKRLSQTKYIDRMREALIKKLEDQNR